MKKRVLIVGGGAAGLAAAYDLKRRGAHSVTVLEASGRAGGRMAGEVVDGFHIDTGAQLFSTAYTEALGLCEELGISFDSSPVNITFTIYNGRTGKTGVLDTSRLFNLTNAKTILSFSLFSPKAHRQFLKFARFMLSRRADFHSGDHTRLLDLDHEGTFAQWAGERFGEEFVQQFCESPVASITLSQTDRIGPLHGMMLLWMALLERRNVLQMPEQGIGSFARALARSCEDVTRLSTPVESIVIRDGSVKGVQTGEGFLEADAVICATTAPEALGLVDGLPSGTREILEGIRYSSCCHVVFGVDRHPLPNGHYFFMFQNKGDSFLDCYLDSTVGSPRSAPPGHGLIHAYPGEDHSEELFKLSDEQIKRRVIDEIRKYTPSMPEEPLFTRVYRWERAVCIPPGGLMRRLHSLMEEGFPGVPGLFLAGEYLALLSSINGSLKSGFKAAADANEYLRALPPRQEKIG
ncbi:MAG: FAD-dependent oxidoreductase [Acidimicrobiia bacterium]|nr:FAD-dependent oxidoreductase [Acidimicrobiia bacterium]